MNIIQKQSCDKQDKLVLKNTRRTMIYVDELDMFEAEVVRSPRRPEPEDLEDQYTFVQEIPAEYKCLVCTKLLREPQVTECCGQHFCLYCLEKWLQDHRGKPCPMCRTLRCNYMRYLPMKRDIDELEVYCTNKKLGCTSILALKDADKHQNICDFGEVSCFCGKKLLRKEMSDHKRNTCPKRQVQCVYCKERGPYQKIKTKLHQTKCPDFPLNCPNCGTPGIKRRNLKNHKKTCPMMPVECPFSNAGCQERVCRRDLKTHEANCVQQHLLLVMNSFSQLSVQHDNLKKAHETLQKEHTELKQKVSQQSAKKSQPTRKPRRTSGYRSDSWQDDDDDDPGYRSTASQIVQSSHWEHSPRRNSRFGGPRGNYSPRRRWERDNDYGQSRVDAYYHERRDDYSRNGDYSNYYDDD